MNHVNRPQNALRFPSRRALTTEGRPVAVPATTMQKVNRNSLAQFWRKRLPLLPTWRGGTYNVGRNKAKRAERAREAEWMKRAARGTGESL